MIIDKDLQHAEISADYGAGGDRLIAELRSKGISKIKRAMKGAHSINPGIQYIQGFEVIIHPSCIHTVEEFNTYTFTQDSEGRWLNKPIDANNHIIDALRYSLERFHIKRKKKKSSVAKNVQAIKRMGL